jgi:GAF domain-containing protein
LIILRNSGEIPEIALHTTLYYLEEDEEGPGITLIEEELHQLHDAALARAREIVLRDLDPDNRDLGLYRGPARSIVNWRRLQNFCQRIGRQCHGFNNTAEDITAFCEELRMDTDLLPDRWVCLCRD